MELSAFLAVGAGAFAGAVLRWLLGLALDPLLGALKLGTLAANLGGGLLMGMVLAVSLHGEGLPPTARLALTTGFLGGLTTFSAFSGEAVSLLLRQQYAIMGLLVLAHTAGSLLATFGGFHLARTLLRA